jgi:WD40 repeat protein
VAVASDGGLVSASSSHVRLWDSTSGALRWQVFTPAEQTRFALSRDGKAIAIAQGDFDTARVSIYEVGGPQRASFESGPVTGLAFSPDGSKLAVASASVVIYQASDGKRLSGLKGYALTIGFSEDGALIVVGRDGIQRWNGTDAAAAPVSAFSAPPSAAAVAPSSGVVAWANGSSLQISTPKGSPIKIEAAATSPITALAISAKGDVVLVGWPGGIAAWDVGPTPTKRWQMETRFKSRPAIALDESATTVGIADARGVFIAEASTGKELRTKGERLRFLGFAGDGNLLVARGQVYESVDLHTAARTPTRDLPEGAPAWVDSYVYGAKGTATGWSSAAVAECAPLKIWVTGVGERSIRPPLGCKSENGDPWLPGPGFVVADGSKSTVWDVVENKPRMDLLPSRRPRLALSFSADRRWLVAAYGAADSTSSGHDQGTFVVAFDLSTAKPGAPGRPARELEWREASTLRAITILPDGTTYAGAENGDVFAAAPGEAAFQKVAQLGAGITFLEASPSGTAIAATDQDGLTAILGK